MNNYESFANAKISIMLTKLETDREATYFKNQNLERKIKVSMDFNIC